MPNCFQLPKIELINSEGKKKKKVEGGVREREKKRKKRKRKMVQAIRFCFKRVSGFKN